MSAWISIENNVYFCVFSSILNHVYRCKHGHSRCIILASRQPIKQMSPPLEYSTNPKHEEKEAKDEINQKKTARISFREKTGHRLPFVDRSQHTETGEHIQKIGVCIPAVFDETGSGATNVDTSKPAPIMNMCACISA